MSSWTDPGQDLDSWTTTGQVWTGPNSDILANSRAPRGSMRVDMVCMACMPCVSTCMRRHACQPCQVSAGQLAGVLWLKLDCSWLQLADHSRYYERAVAVSVELWSFGWAVSMRAAWVAFCVAPKKLKHYFFENPSKTYISKKHLF